MFKHKPELKALADNRFDRRLVSGLDNEGLEDFKSRWQSSTSVREAIGSILTKELQDAILKSESTEVLASPNALAVLADHAGYRRAIRFTLKLLNQQE